MPRVDRFAVTQNKACLTTQPFQPKLRLSKSMLGKTQRIAFFALFLGVILLTAQFHLCADLTAGPSSSHICPICSTAGSVVPTQAPSMAIVPAMKRLEVFAVIVPVSTELPRTTSPRAPPVQ